MPEWMTKLIARAMPQVNVTGTAGKNVQLGYIKGNVTELNVYLSDSSSPRANCRDDRDSNANEVGEKWLH